MNWSEVFTAIQQGTIDGQENGVSITSTSKMQEVQDYLTMWNYSYENDLFVANTEVWNSLEPETQELLQACATEACEWGRDALEAEEAEILEEFEAGGMTITYLTEEEQAAFDEAIAPFKAEMIEYFRCRRLRRVRHHRLTGGGICHAENLRLDRRDHLRHLHHRHDRAGLCQRDLPVRAPQLPVLLRGDHHLPLRAAEHDGTAIAAKRRAHLGLSIITDAVGPKVHKALMAIGFGIATVFSAALFYYGILMVMNQYNLGMQTSAMQWPEWIYATFIPFGAFFITIRFAQALVQELKACPETEQKIEEGKEGV